MFDTIISTISGEASYGAKNIQQLENAQSLQAIRPFQDKWWLQESRSRQSEHF